MFILKSRSPRRIEILKTLGIQFEIQPSDIDEREIPGELPLSYLERIAKAKIGSPGSLDLNSSYLSCDTIVVQNNRILHKPENFEDAVRILSNLNGKSHSVFSGACLYSVGQSDFFYEETEIAFKKWSISEIESYIHRAQPFDKAGSYGIQDSGGPVREWRGRYHNVVGFPLFSFLGRSKIWKEYWGNENSP
ncbi:Maf family protein [Leptospira ilyithenensis]|uniref:dTTP/UTP pyrophosphatase n=1 Tax=Leptospira ilyithenensis TaxID=2484901 RepID=A0A4R9LS44_9LEPT|nr:nucleoside triphosphate pyrophosphatase [Leptospira ilyithenensis]TGN10988.1 septum formation protein Maf [Leptospira ilyithenensis]